MKKLHEYVKSLKGEEETITISDLRANPGDLFEQVRLGKVFHVSRVGRIIATISPPEPNALELGAEIRRLGLTGDSK